MESKFAFYAIVTVISGLLIVIPTQVFGLNYPSGDSGWEKHKTNPWEVGARATYSSPNPSVVLTGTD